MHIEPTNTAFHSVFDACLDRQEPREEYQALTDPDKYTAPMRRKRKPEFSLKTEDDGGRR